MSVALEKDVRLAEEGLPNRPSSVRVWLLAVRPATLWASVVPVVVGTSVAVAEGLVRWGPACAALVAMLLIQVGTNLFNDYADFQRGADTAARLGPPRMTQQGWLTPAQVLWGTVVAFATACALGGYLQWIAGWPVAVLGLLSIACGLAYTGGPWPLGYHGLGDIFVFICFGLAAVLGTYYVQATALSWAALWASIPVGCLATAILVVNNLRDHLTDAEAGKRTLAVRFGTQFARREYCFLLAVAYAIPVFVWVTGRGSGSWLLPCLTAPLAWRSLLAVGKLEGKALNPLLGQTARIEIAFGLLLAAGVMW